MEEKNSILNLMLDQHALIEALFFVFKDDETERSLKDFSWEIKKHFFIEEGAIFDFLAWNDSQIAETIKRLKEEHIEMLNMLAKMAYVLPKTSAEDLDKFYEILKGHRETEEEELYPVLDKRLTEGQKEQVVNRINQVLIRK